MPTATMHDGSNLEVEVSGAGPVVLLPVDPRPVEGPQAATMRAWGADPALGRSLIDGLADAFRVVAFDYQGHVLAHPKPETLTPANVARDFLTVADVAAADRFAYYGYSWLALCGLQLAIRTNRLSALVMGGYPPVDGPYGAMLRVTTAAHEMAVARESSSSDAGGASVGSASPEEFDWSAVEVTMSVPQTRQFVTLYRALQDFDDRAVQHRITCPRLCFAGSADEINYGERWGGVRVSIAGPLRRGREELADLGWEARVLDGLDHTQAMQADRVLPVLRPWLESALAQGATSTDR